MRHAILGLVALAGLLSSTGCCCFERWCDRRGAGAWYGGYHGVSGCDCCGVADCDGGCDDCGCGPGGYDGPYDGGPVYEGRRPAHPRFTAQPHAGHPHIYRQRNSGGEHEFAAGPPTAGVTYPYYTNRGARDFLAKNPRSIGP